MSQVLFFQFVELVVGEFVYIGNDCIGRHIDCLVGNLLTCTGIRSDKVKCIVGIMVESMNKHGFRGIIFPFYNTLTVKKNIVTGIEHSVGAFFHPYSHFGEVVGFGQQKTLFKQSSAIAKNPNIRWIYAHGIECFVGQFVNTALFDFYFYKFARCQYRGRYVGVNGSRCFERF